MKKLAILAILSCACATANAAGTGWVDQADSVRVKGWACTSDQPNYQGWLHIYRDDGHFIGAVFAGNHREQAVGDRCGGNSDHGFSGNLDYPSNLIDGKAHNVHFYFIGPNSNFEIPGSPVRVQFGNPPPPPPEPLTLSGCNITNPGSDWVGIYWRADVGCSPPWAPYSGTRMTYQYLGSQSDYVYRSGDTVVTCTSNSPKGWYSAGVVDSFSCPSNYYGYVQNAFLLKKY